MFNIVKIFFFFLSCIVVFHANPCLGTIQFKPKNSLLTAEQISNPKPSAGDIILPMPYGLSLVLRPVCIPASGYLDSTEIHLGVQPFFSADKKNKNIQAENDKGQYAEQEHLFSITAPFGLEDLPLNWKKNIDEYMQQNNLANNNLKSAIKPYLYFIGKYEITRGQWRSVMGKFDENNPFKLEEDDYLPVTNISWFDAFEFTHRYTEWVMQNHPEMLPYFVSEQRYAFFRLPSEAEWEFAARGGHKVSSPEHLRTQLYPIPEHTDYSEYIAARYYDSSITGLSPVGSKKANPLELYDILGNCSEMLLSPFRLIAGNKQIGTYGGFIIKGGSWRASTLEELNPGKRTEASYYVQNKAQTRDDMGFRIVLGSILTPKDRRGVLFEEWKNRTYPKAAQATKDDDVRSIIRNVNDEIEDIKLKEALARAEQLASLYYEKVNENEERMIRETLIGALFSLETIANYAARGSQLVHQLELYEINDHDNKEDELEKNTIKKQIYGFTEGIHSALFYYLSMMRECSRYNKESLLIQLEKVSLQFEHDDGFSRNMHKRFKILQKHLQRENVQPLTANEAIADILPDWCLELINPYMGDKNEQKKYN